MALVTSGDADVFETHGVRFSSYVRPSRGSDQLCTWRIEVPAGLRGAPHRLSREEVICCVDGELTITLDAAVHQLRPGDVAYVPSGSEIRLDGGPGGGAALTTSLAGLEATMSDGSRLRPWTVTADDVTTGGAGPPAPVPEISKLYPERGRLTPAPRLRPAAQPWGGRFARAASICSCGSS